VRGVLHLCLLALTAFPPPPDAPELLPSLVHHLRVEDGGVGIQDAEGAMLTPAGEVLVWGGNALTVVDPVSGQQTRLVTCARRLTRLNPAPDGLWFFDDELWFLDLATLRTQRASSLFGAEYKKVSAVLSSTTGQLFKETVLPDGTLVLEWKLYDEIPVLFGGTRAQWGLRPRLDSEAPGHVYSRVFLHRSGVIRFEVDTVPQVHRPDDRDRTEGARLLTPDGGVIGPVLGNSYSGDLTGLELAGVRVQPFELRRHPKTYEPCAPGSDIVARSAEYTMATNISNEHCTRLSGAYLERSDDKHLIFTMTHGPTMPSAMTVRGDLLVQSGLHDTFAPSSLSLWDLRTGGILERLSLPKDIGRLTKVVAVMISADSKKIYAVTSAEIPSVVTWVLPSPPPGCRPRNTSDGGVLSIDLDGDPVPDEVRVTDRTVEVRRSKPRSTTTLSLDWELGGGLAVSLPRLPLQGARHREEALRFIEDSIFFLTCDAPEPSLRRLLQQREKRTPLTWIAGPPQPPFSYVVREHGAWLLYRSYCWKPDGRDPFGPNELEEAALDGNLVVLKTCHGVLLNDLEHHRFAWLYLLDQPIEKLRHASIGAVSIANGIVTIQLTLDTGESPQIRVRISDGTISR
jgi:hypothetical protein